MQPGIWPQDAENGPATTGANFDDGKIRRDEADDLVFAFVTPGHVVACKLLVLGVDGQVLKTIDLLAIPGTPPNQCAMWESGE